MRTDAFQYELPPELIAQSPAEARDDSRLLVLERASGAIAHRRFPDLLEYLRPGDALILNDSRVLPARLRSVKPETGGQVELLLAEKVGPNEWWVMLKPGRRVRPGTCLRCLQTDGALSPITATVREKSDEGLCRVAFAGTPNLFDALEGIGEVPLPPYIARPDGPRADDADRYQTVFARATGSVAAPTAGLHFTRELLDRVRASGVRVGFVTLHVGLATFAPVKVARLEAHRMHEENFELPEATAGLISATRRGGGRVVAVGTTTVRVLETAAAAGGELVPGRGRTRLFIYPPRTFRVVDALLTNFHLPQSTLLMLVSAFAAPGQVHGRDLILRAYAEAVARRYRFFSYGDALLLL